MTLEQEALRGRLAADVLSNEVYAEAYALVEAGIIAKWREADATEQRERLHLMLGLLSKLRGVMEGTMKSGEIATQTLVDQKSRLARIGQALRA